MPFEFRNCKDENKGPPHGFERGPLYDYIYQGLFISDLHHAYVQIIGAYLQYHREDQI